MPSAQGREIVQEVFEWKKKVEQEKRRITSVCQPRGAERPSIASGLAPAATRLRAGSSDQYRGSRPPDRTGSSKAATRRSRHAPDANTTCHGWMLEFDGACWARLRASSTNSRHRLAGQKHSRRMALSDRLIKVDHGGPPSPRSRLVAIRGFFDRQPIEVEAAK